jgi:REP element-mobilizing transposase RayT
MKPNNYTQLYIQLVFAVKHREAVLSQNIRPRVFEYLSGILTDLKHKTIIVNGFANHVHVFYGMNPNVSVSSTIYELKRGSSLFINQNRLCLGKFFWQEGYGGFSYSRSDIQAVYEYIKNQEMHHKKKTFREEYLELLKSLEINYDLKYLFDFFE